MNNADGSSEVVTITRREWEDVLGRLDAAVGVIAAAYRAEGLAVPAQLRARREETGAPDMGLPESPRGRSARRRRQAAAIGLHAL